MISEPRSWDTTAQKVSRKLTLNSSVTSINERFFSHITKVFSCTVASTTTILYLIYRYYRWVSNVSNVYCSDLPPPPSLCTPALSFCLVNQVLYNQIEWKMSCYTMYGGASCTVSVYTTHTLVVTLLPMFTIICPVFIIQI